MSDEPSGSHRIPVASEREGGVPRWVLYVVIGVLGGGAGGTGLSAFMHSGVGGGDAVVVQLAQINSRLDLITSKLDDKAKTLDDHERRLRELEDRIRAPTH